MPIVVGLYTVEQQRQCSIEHEIFGNKQEEESKLLGLDASYLDFAGVVRYCLSHCILHSSKHCMTLVSIRYDESPQI